MGAAIATALTQFIAVLWVYRVVIKYDETKYEVLKIFKLILLGFGFFIITQLIDDIPLAWRLIIKSSMLGGYFYILYLWNFFEKIELERIRGGWKKWSNLRKVKENISAIHFE